MGYIGMNAGEIRKLIHPRQTPRFYMALFFSVILSLLLVVATIFTFGILLAYALILVFFVWIALNVMYAMFLANTIKVSDRNYPDIARLVELTKQEIGLSKPVDIFVYQAGEFNAFFRRFFSRRAIFINSELLETGVTQVELKWIIARFVGQVKTKHMLGPIAWIISLAQRLLIFNLFILPYERATAYTGDRIALASIGGDISSAVSAMNKLLVGRSMGYSIDPSGVIDQNKSVKGSFFAFLARLGSNLPHTLPRYVDLIRFSASAFPRQFRFFAAENPSLQPLVDTSSSTALIDTSTPTASAATGSRPAAAAPINEAAAALEGDSHWGVIALPFIVLGVRRILDNILNGMGMYGNFGLERGIGWWIVYYLIVAIPFLIAFVGYARKPINLPNRNVLFGVLAAVLLFPVSLSSNYLSFTTFPVAFDAIVTLDLFHPVIYLDGLQNILLEQSSTDVVLLIVIVVMLFVLREIAFRGYLVGSMKRNGAGVVKIAAMNGVAEVALILIANLIFIAFFMWREITSGYFFPDELIRNLGFYFQSLPRDIVATLIFATSMMAIRLISGRMWLNMIVAGLVGLLAMLS